MVEIKLEPNDQQDIIDLLNYALQKKHEDTDKESYPKYWDLRVPQLKQLIKGKKVYDTIYQSSLGGLVKDVQEGLDDINY